MRGYPANSPCDLFRENLDVNAAGNYSGTQDSDWFPDTARFDGSPARVNKSHDVTAYPNPTPVLVDSWLARQRGWGTSPANNAFPANGTQGGIT